jgi:damage-control phosphatase, subfamily I
VRTGPPCRECILGDVREAAVILSGDESWAEAFIAEVRVLLDGLSLDGRVPSQVITRVHRLLKERSGQAIPFQERRKQTNRVGVVVAEHLQQEMSGLHAREKFQVLARWAVAANSLDFRTAGAGYRFDIVAVEARLRAVQEKGLAVDDSQDLWEALTSAQRILYILDNVGEIAIDGLFIEECLKPGRLVYGVVRGVAITSDVVLEDAVYVGLDKAVDGLVSSGSDTLGILFEEASPILLDELKRADLIIAKGQANYYLLSDPEYRKQIPGKTACLFTTKCDLVAAQFGQKGKLNVLKMV